MYTITLPGGTKDYRLEKGLHELEDHFVRIRDSKLVMLEQLTPQEHVLLLTFLAAMHNRTQVQRDHQKAQWRRVFEVADEMKKWAEKATPEQRRAAASMSVGHGKDTGLTYDDVKQLATDPMQHLLFQMIQTEVPLLYKLDMAILRTDSSPGFITSDHPCVWFDPKAYLRPPFYRAPALMYPTIEITLPVSPSLLIYLNRAGIEGYADLAPTMVDDLNRRTRFSAHQYFVVAKNVTKGIWFHPGVEPEDSWEKTQGKKRGKPTNA